MKEVAATVTYTALAADWCCNTTCKKNAAQKMYVLQIFAELLEHARRVGIVSNNELSSASAKLEQAEATAADLQSGGGDCLAEDSEDEELMSVALLQEEVVMYQRAISRLSEMCRVQPA